MQKEKLKRILKFDVKNSTIMSARERFPSSPHRHIQTSTQFEEPRVIGYKLNFNMSLSCGKNNEPFKLNEQLIV